MRTAALTCLLVQVAIGVAVLGATGCGAIWGFDELSRNERGEATDDAGAAGDAGEDSLDSMASNVDADTSDSDAAFVYAAAVKGTLFFDDFERSDGQIGNGWSTPGTFSLQSGGVILGALTSGAAEIVYRPNPLVSDEVSGLVTLAAPETATLYARVRPESGNLFSDYEARVASNRIHLERRISVLGGGLTSFPWAKIDPPLVGTSAYRFFFRVSGTNPVVLEAGLFTAAGAHIASVRVTDADARRLVEAGGMGFGLSSPNGSTRWESFACSF